MMLVVSSWCRLLRPLAPTSQSESDSERAGRTRAANFFATRFAYDSCENLFSLMTLIERTSRVWQLEQLSTRLCGGVAQLTVAVR